MGYGIPLKGQKVSDGGGKTFEPLEAGPIGLAVFDAEVKQYGDKTKNAGRDFLKIQFKVLDGQTGANRRLFQSIGLFPEWAPTDKNPNGSDNFTFFAFFAAVQGKKEKDFRAEMKKAIEDEDEKFTIPSARELLGKKVTAILKIVPDTYAYDQYKLALKNGTEELADGEEEKTQSDFLKNDIAGFKVYTEGEGSGGSAAPKDAFVL